MSKGRHLHVVALIGKPVGYIITELTVYRTGWSDVVQTEERFKFCPECGAELLDFWAVVDIDRKNHRLFVERKELEDQAYRFTPPT